MKGVFTHEGIGALIKAGRIIPRDNFSPEHINNASLDLTIGDEIYEVACVIKPKQGVETVRELLPLMCAKPHDIAKPLRAGKSYLARSSIDINFSPGLFARANAKSTSGRLFTQSRLLADRVDAFDTIDMRHQGIAAETWLVIEPLGLDIIHSPSECYLQLKIYNNDASLTREDLLTRLETEDLLFDKETGQPHSQGDITMHTYDGTLLMTLHAEGAEQPVGYRLRRTAGKRAPVPLDAREIAPGAYFEPVYATELVPGDPRSWGVWLEAGELYLLATNERVRVPLDISSTLKELDSRHGDAVIHFAGFIDPGFFGTITLEVRAPRRVFLRHGSPIATAVFERMQGHTFAYDGNYHGFTGAKLPKQFRSF